MSQGCKICLGRVELDMCIARHSNETRLTKRGFCYMKSQCLGCQREQVCSIGYGVIMKSGEDVIDSFVLTICAKIVEVSVGATCR